MQKTLTPRELIDHARTLKKARFTLFYTSAFCCSFTLWQWGGVMMSMAEMAGATLTLFMDCSYVTSSFMCISCSARLCRFRPSNIPNYLVARIECIMYKTRTAVSYQQCLPSPKTRKRTPKYAVLRPMTKMREVTQYDHKN